MKLIKCYHCGKFQSEIVCDSCVRAVENNLVNKNKKVINAEEKEKVDELKAEFSNPSALIEAKEE